MWATLIVPEGRNDCPINSKGQPTTNTLATKQSSSTCPLASEPKPGEFCSPHKQWFLTDSIHFYHKGNQICPWEQRPSAFSRTQLPLRTCRKCWLLLRKICFHIKFLLTIPWSHRQPNILSGPWMQDLKSLVRKILTYSTESQTILKDASFSKSRQLEIIHATKDY